MATLEHKKLKRYSPETERGTTLVGFLPRLVEETHFIRVSIMDAR